MEGNTQKMETDSTPNQPGVQVENKNVIHDSDNNIPKQPGEFSSVVEPHLNNLSGMYYDRYGRER
jgi:hypothetical protein